MDSLSAGMIRQNDNRSTRRERHRLSDTHPSFTHLHSVGPASSPGSMLTRSTVKTVVFSRADEVYGASQNSYLEAELYKSL